MRTDLYERSPGQTFVYVKFRCRRCKRLGQTFVPEAQWDWRTLEPARDELSDAERDRLSDAGPISEGEFLDFHQHLKNLETLNSLDDNSPPPQEKLPSKESKESRPPSLRLDLKPERKDDARDAKLDSKLDSKLDAKRDTNCDKPLGANGANGDARPDDFGAV